MQNILDNLWVLQYSLLNIGLRFADILHKNCCEKIQEKLISNSWKNVELTKEVKDRQAIVISYDPLITGIQYIKETGSNLFS